MVEYQEVDAQSILSAVEDYESRVAEYDVPSDGLVLIYDDIAYGQSLAGQQSSPGIPSPLNGRMKPRKQRFRKSNGAQAVRG